MNISGATVDRLAMLRSSYHVIRFRSPTVYFKPWCFNKINAIRSVSALHSSDHTIEPPIAPLQLKSPSGQLLSGQDEQNNKEENLEEIIYCFIVQKFAENDISMTPSDQVDSWPVHQEQKLRAIHASEAMDMIDSHLRFVTERFVGQLSKLKLGKLYAANVKYGYYLKRVHDMFEKERSDMKPDSFWDVESTILYADEGDDVTNRLRSYVMQLDAETLKRYATIRSKEAMSLIEKHEHALFSAEEKVVGVTSAGLTSLVLEAVAFGSFLWEAECFIKYIG